MSKEPVCSTCGQPAKGMTTICDVSSLRKILLCGRCAALGHANSLTSIEEADHFIAEATENLSKLEE